MKKWQRISLSALATFLLATVLLSGALSHPPAAHAGSNGQQLAFVPGCSSNWAYIQGYNQNNVWVTQWFLVVAAVPESGCVAPTTQDWGFWWKTWQGQRVRVDAYWGYSNGVGSGYQGTTYVDVTTSQDGDWVTVGMPGG